MQEDYTNDMTVARAGMLVGNGHSIGTKNSQTDEIPFGVMVAKTVGEDNGIELFAHPTAVKVGVVALTFSTTDTSYETEYPIPVVNIGEIRVPVNQTVTADDSVYIQFCETLNIQTVTFDIDFVASNSIAFTINGDVQTPIVYATSHAATIAALATAIEAHADVLTAVAAGRVITVTSVNADALTMEYTVTLGGSQAVDTIATSTAGVAGDEQGYFRKDSNSNTAVAAGSNYRFVEGAADEGFAILSVNQA